MRLKDISGIAESDKLQLSEVVKQFEFRVTPYYASLIDWSDPLDPLRMIVLPNPSELDSDLPFDASHEADYTVDQGVQHKYGPTALLLVNDVCAAYCRFCFRKRFTLSTSQQGQIVPSNATYNKETTFNVEHGINYIADHPEIDNVLLTGGDPLMLSAHRLEAILAKLRSIPHVKIIRIGTKVPAFDPDRMSDYLLDMIARFSFEDMKIYLMVHFNHPRELTPLATRKLELAQQKGLTLFNQTPLLRGINDNPDVLASLFEGLSKRGITPYYLFHCRPTKGNEAFMLTLQEGLEIVKETRKKLNGLAKCFHYVGSHSTGKIEVVGVTDEQIILKYHQPQNPIDQDKIMMWSLYEHVYWFDEIVDNSVNPHVLSSRQEWIFG